MKMQIKNSDDQFGIVAVVFHWLMAFLIIFMLVLGFYMADLPKGHEQTSLINLHKSVGILILFSVALRLFWRAINVTPILIIPRWERVAARSVHWVLYILMFAMPITGWLMSSAGGKPPVFFGLFTLPDLVPPSKNLADLFLEIHESLAVTLVILIILHTASAFRHHFIYKDNILKRMLGFGIIR